MGPFGELQSFDIVASTEHCSTYFAHLEYCYIRKAPGSQEHKVLLERGSSIGTMIFHWNSETPSEQESFIGTMRLHQNNEASWEQQGSIGTTRLHWNNKAPLEQRGSIITQFQISTCGLASVRILIFSKTNTLVNVVKEEMNW